MKRVDLTAPAGGLIRDDGAGGRWRFEGVEHIPHESTGRVARRS